MASKWRVTTSDGQVETAARRTDAISLGRGLVQRGFHVTKVEVNWHPDHRDSKFVPSPRCLEEIQHGNS